MGIMKRLVLRPPKEKAKKKGTEMSFECSILCMSKHVVRFGNNCRTMFCSIFLKINQVGFRGKQRNAFPIIDKSRMNQSIRAHMLQKRMSMPDYPRNVLLWR